MVESILLPVSVFLRSVTKLWDMIICLCMCKGWTHHVNVLERKSSPEVANKFDFSLPITVNWESESYISDKTYWQNSSEWCHTSHGRSCPCSIRISLNDNRHAAFIHVSNCTTLSTDLVRMVEIFEIAYGTSWKLRRTSWISNGEEVEQ